MILIFYKNKLHNNNYEFIYLTLDYLIFYNQIKL